MGSYLNSLIGYATTTFAAPVGGTVAAVSGASGAVQSPAIRGAVAGTSAAAGNVTASFPVGGTAAGSSSAAASVQSSSGLYAPSQIGYATTTFSDPVVAFAVSGRASASTGASGSVGLTGSTTHYGASQIGFATTVFTDPAGPNGYGPSLIGFATTTFRAPHRPILVKMPNGTLKATVIRTWDGTKLR